MAKIPPPTIPPMPIATVLAKPRLPRQLLSPDEDEPVPDTSLPDTSGVPSFQDTTSRHFWDS